MVRQQDRHKVILSYKENSRPTLSTGEAKAEEPQVQSSSEILSKSKARLSNLVRSRLKVKEKKKPRYSRVHTCLAGKGSGFNPQYTPHKKQLFIYPEIQVLFSYFSLCGPGKLDLYSLF